MVIFKSLQYCTMRFAFRGLDTDLAIDGYMSDCAQRGTIKRQHFVRIKSQFYCLLLTYSILTLTVSTLHQTQTAMTSAES